VYALEKLFHCTAADATSEARRQQAAGVLACMVGGQILARLLNNTEGAQFLADCQGFLRDALIGGKKPHSWGRGSADQPVVAQIPLAGMLYRLDDFSHELLKFGRSYAHCTMESTGEMALAAKAAG
jgi:hypothetical protein